MGGNNAEDSVHGADLMMVIVDLPALQYKVTRMQLKMRRFHFSSIWQ